MRKVKKGYCNNFSSFVVTAALHLCNSRFSALFEVLHQSEMHKVLRRLALFCPPPVRRYPRQGLCHTF